MPAVALRSAPTSGAFLATALLGGLIAVGLSLVILPYDYQVYVVLLIGIGLLSAWLIPRMVAQDASVTVLLLGGALLAKIGGSLGRFFVLENLYGGGDAVAYHASGEAWYQMVRALDFSFIQPPYQGTDFVRYTVPFVYSAIGPSMIAGFLVFAMAAFVGTWFFYRAHRIAFPQGDARAYFLLMFFLPTMVFWPSSLGKDALMVFGLGVSTYGLAKLLQRITFGAFLQFGLGFAMAFGVRSFLAIIFLFAACLAFLIRPGGFRSPMNRPVAWILLGPVIAVGFIYAFQISSDFLLKDEGFIETFDETRANLFQGGSAFESADPTTPSGAITAVPTVLFRPLPWELQDSELGALAGLEALFVLGFMVWNGKAAWQAVRRWRGGMIVAALITSVGLIAALSVSLNFGLLVRQRAQLLPFLFILFTAYTARQHRRHPPPAVVGP